MVTPTLTHVTISDRNEAKFLFALGFIGTPSPRNNNQLDFEFDATDLLFGARRNYSLNAPVPIQSFIVASIFVDGEIHSHRLRGGM